MARRSHGRPLKAGTPPKPVSTPVIRHDAAGIDIGANELWVSVPPERDPQPVRRFETFTDSLRELAAWLRQCAVKTVAMESTGVYWIPVFQILEAEGFEVCLVNARHFKNVDGRKTDVLDCQWLQYCHSVGLLRASFRPAHEVVALRTIVRHRARLLQTATAEVQHIHKALTQMNVQVHNVLSDITGESGMAILDAILEGTRDPAELADLCNHRVRATRDRLVRSLEGDWRAEHVFTLRQSLGAYRHLIALTVECDREIARMVAAMNSARSEPSEPDPNPSDRPEGSPSRSGGSPPKRGMVAESVAEFMRLFGTDLSQVDGFGPAVLQTLLSEIGPDLSRFPNHKAFGRWIGLAPNPQVSGGRELRRHGGSVAGRAAWALRMAAQALWRSNGLLGQKFKRLRARLGAAKAITAMAYKLARIFYHLVTTGEPYDESKFAEAEDRYQERRKQRLIREVREYGYDVVPGAVVS